MNFQYWFCQTNAVRDMALIVLKSIQNVLKFQSIEGYFEGNGRVFESQIIPERSLSLLLRSP